MKKEKQLTAVEWLFNQLSLNNLLLNQGTKVHKEIEHKILEQAQLMEKEQMLNAFQESRLTHPMIGFKHETFVDYYKQTFKSE